MGMDNVKIDRINALAHKAKSVVLQKKKKQSRQNCVRNISQQSAET